MTTNSMILKSIYKQIDTITDILYKIYAEKTMSEKNINFLKKVHKRLYNFIKTQEARIQKHKALKRPRQ